MNELSGLKIYAIWFILLMFIPILGHRKILTAQNVAIAAIEEKNSGLEKVLAQRREILAVLKSRSEAALAAEKGVNAFVAVLPTRALVPDILDGFARLAEASGIALLGAAHSRATAHEAEPLTTLDIDMTFTGSFDGMRRFVLAVDGLETAVKVTALKAADRKEGVAGSITCRVLIGGN